MFSANLATHFDKPLLLFYCSLIKYCFQTDFMVCFIRFNYFGGKQEILNLLKTKKMFKTM